MYKLLVLSLSLSGLAMAAAHAGPASSLKPIPVLKPTPVRVRPYSAPEIDSRSALGAATLLIGGLMVLRARVPD